MSKLKNLEVLSLENNLVTHMPNYRIYVKHLCPNLINLDSKSYIYSEMKKSINLFSGRLTNQKLKNKLGNQKIKNIQKLDLSNFDLNHYSNELNLRYIFVAKV